LISTQFSLQVGLYITVSITSYCDQDLIAAFYSSGIESKLSIEVYEIICICSRFDLDDHGVSRANVRIIEDRNKFSQIRSITVSIQNLMSLIIPPKLPRFCTVETHHR